MDCFDDLREDEYGEESQIEHEVRIMANEQIAKRIDQSREDMACRFGPVWKQTYHILIDLLGTIMSEPMIREILSFHAASPPAINPTHYFLAQFAGDDEYTFSHTFKNPQCFSCLDSPGIWSGMYATVTLYSSGIKLRFICSKCMPPLLFKYTKSPEEFIRDYPGIGPRRDNIDFTETKKFGPGLVPQNESAAGVSICMDDRTKICKYYHIINLSETDGSVGIIMHMSYIEELLDLITV
jgi:hypothetical protein